MDATKTLQELRVKMLQEDARKLGYEIVPRARVRGLEWTREVRSTDVGNVQMMRVLAKTGAAAMGVQLYEAGVIREKLVPIVRDGVLDLGFQRVVLQIQALGFPPAEEPAK